MLKLILLPFLVIVLAEAALLAFSIAWERGAVSTNRAVMLKGN